MQRENKGCSIKCSPWPTMEEKKKQRKKKSRAESTHINPEEEVEAEEWKGKRCREVLHLQEEVMVPPQ